MQKRLSAISLYSGAGGMDFGFARAGFDVVWANDIDPVACETYRLNDLGDVRCGDLADYWDELRDVGSPTLVFGGPPCQGFSVAGKMDPRDRRNLQMAHFFDAVEITKPVAFVCENVKGLAVLSRWAAFRQQLFERIDALGYTHTLLVLSAADFGVPQARERMFLIGAREDLLTSNDIDLNVALTSLLNEQKSEPPQMSDVIRRLGPAGSPNNARICKAKVTYAKNPVLRRSPYAGMLFNGAGRPIKPFGASSTLPASMGGNKTPIVDEDEIFGGKPSFVERYHKGLRRGDAPRTGTAPKRLRRLTIDECLAIQTFPNDFALAGPQSAMYRQIGNAVPCNLAQAVATAVRDFVLANTVAGTPQAESSPSLKLAS